MELTNLNELAAISYDMPQDRRGSAKCCLCMFGSAAQHAQHFEAALGEFLLIFNKLANRHRLLLLPVLLFTSCATITRGVHEKLYVRSDPPGAEAVLSTGERGVTPCKFVEARRTDNFTVTVSKGGYAPQTVQVRSEASGTGAMAMGGNLILGGIIGAGVDAASGAYKSLYPNPVSVRLVPVRGKYSTTRSTTTTPKANPESVQLLATPSPTP